MYNETRYKEYRNKLHSALQSPKREYFKEKLDHNNAKYIGGLLDKKHRYTCKTVIIDGYNNVVCNNAAVDKFNECYINMGPDLIWKNYAV